MNDTAGAGHHGRLRGWSRHIPALAVALALGAAAGWINTRPIDAFGEHSPHLLLGGALVWAACEALSPSLGAVVALVSLAPQLSRLEPSGLVTSIYLLEYALVWLAQQRFRSFGFTTVLFWVTCGIPLDLALYRWGLGLSADYIALLWLKQVLNGAINGLIVDALLLLAGPGLARLTTRNAAVAPSGVSMAFRLMTLLCFVPIVAATLMAGRQNVATSVEHAYALAEVSTDVYARTVQERMASREVELQLFSRQIDLAAPVQPELLQDALRAFLRRHTEFVNVCVTDAAGTVVSSAPEVNADGSQFLGRSVAVRPYFQTARDHGVIAWAPLILGTMHVRSAAATEPVMIVAAPLMERSLKFRGVVFVAMDPKLLFADLHRNAPESPVTRNLVDQTGHVVESDLSTRAPGAELLPGRLPQVGDGSHNARVTYLDTSEPDTQQRVRLDARRYAATAPVGRAGLTAVAEVPASWAHATMATANWAPIWLLLTSVIGAAAVSHWATGWVRQTFRGWQALLEDAAAGDEAAFGHGARPPAGPLAETAALSGLVSAVVENAAQRRSAATAAIAVSAGRIQTLLDHAVAGVTVKGRDGRYVLANARFASVHGVAPSTLSGLTDRDICGPDTAARLETLESVALATGEPGELDYTIDVHGVARTFARRVFPIPSPSADAPLIGAITMDVTERRQQETLLRASEERYRTIADYTYDWEYWLAADGTLRWMSPSCARVSGYSVDAFLRNPDLLQLIVHPDDRATVVSHFRKVETCPPATELPDQHDELEFRIQTKDGDTRWIGHVCQPVISESGVYLGRRASNRDMTASKQAAEERLQLVSQNLRLQKAQSLAQMAGGIAHLMNNQLTIVLGSLDLVESATSQADRQERIRMAQRATDRSVEIGRFLLTYLGQVPGRRQTVDLAEVCQDVRDAAAQRVSADIAITSDWTIPGPTASVDSEQIRSAVWHLVENGAEAIGSRPGTVRISVAIVDGATVEGMGRHYPLEWTPAPHPYIAISVIDTGEGIPPENLDKVFDPFFTTRFPGRGLGLTVVAAVARDHGGVVNLHSGSTGTTVRLLVPAEPEGAAALS